MSASVSSESKARELSVWEPARLADCMDPDSTESPGAKFLKAVRDDYLEALGYGDGETLAERASKVIEADYVTEIADGAPDVYTARRWAEFVDLGAWTEDVRDAGDHSDLTEAAGVALYQIAYRLVDVLAGLDSQ